MEHSSEYFQAKDVVDNPQDYEQQALYDARNYIRGYDDALSILVDYHCSCKICGFKYQYQYKQEILK